MAPHIISQECAARRCGENHRVWQWKSSKNIWQNYRRKSDELLFWLAVYNVVELAIIPRLCVSSDGASTDTETEHRGGNRGDESNRKFHHYAARRAASRSGDSGEDSQLETGACNTEPGGRSVLWEWDSLPGTRDTGQLMMYSCPAINRNPYIYSRIFFISDKNIFNVFLLSDHYRLLTFKKDICGKAFLVFICFWLVVEWQG